MSEHCERSTGGCPEERGRAGPGKAKENGTRKAAGSDWCLGEGEDADTELVLRSGWENFVGGLDRSCLGGG